MRRLLLLLFFLVGSLSRVAAQSMTAKDSGNWYIDQSRVLSKGGQREKGRQYVERAIQVFTDAHLLTELGFAYWELAGYSDLSPAQAAEKIQHIQQAVQAWHQAGNVKKEADGLKELADIQQINGNNKEAWDELRRALELYKTIHEPFLQGVYDLLGSVSNALEMSNDAVHYGLLAVEMAERFKDTSTLCAIYNHVGISYYYLRDFPRSCDYFAKALAVAERRHAYEDIYEISYNYGGNLTLMGRMAESNQYLSRVLATYPKMDTSLLIMYTCVFLSNCTRLGQYANAGKYLRRLTSYTEGRVLTAEEQARVRTASLQYLIKSGQFEQARQLAETPPPGNYTLVRQAAEEQWWVALDSAAGNYRNAFAHFRKYVRLEDSILKKESSKSIALLNIQYETSKKDQDILLKTKNIELLQQKSQLQAIDLMRANQARNWTLAAGALLVIIVGLLIRISQIRLRANRELRSQQKEIEKKNASLEQLVEEKDWLVKEIHHRVKNNFHMVIALLGTQSKFLQTKEAMSAIADSQNRVYAMSLVHQKLYQSETLSSVPVPDYIHDLIHYLKNSLNDTHAVQFRTAIDEVELNLTYCIPLGLIINEAVTNSIKYAFPDGREGIICIHFKRVEGDRFMLRIADNGVGLPDGFRVHTVDSMGMKLMNGLTDELDGKLRISGAGGTEIIIEFSTTAI